jgi:hypothetical protein
MPERRVPHGPPGRAVGGFGRTEFELVEIPDGWMPFDPYTYCTYCPVCSEELFGDACNQDALAEVPADFDHYLVLT